jgi:hypothetical protein
MSNTLAYYGTNFNYGRKNFYDTGCGGNFIGSHKLRPIVKDFAW